MEEEWEVGIWGLEESESKSRREDSKEREGGLEREGGGREGSDVGRRDARGKEGVEDRERGRKKGREGGREIFHLYIGVSPLHRRPSPPHLTRALLLFCLPPVL